MPWNEMEFDDARTANDGFHWSASDLVERILRLVP